MPRPDPEFNNFQSEAVSYFNAHLVACGLVAGDTAPLAPLQAIWAAAFAANDLAQTAAQGANAAKDAARKSLETALRALVARIQANTAVTDATKLAAGLPARDKTRTPAPVPTTSPVGVVDTSQRLSHVINYRDATSGKSTAKPKGVMGCELWVKVGDTPPADASECRFLAMDCL